LPMDDPLPPYAGNGYNPSYGAQALPPAQQPVQQPMQQPQQPVQPQQPAQPSAQPQQPAAYTPPTTSNNEEDIFGGAGDFSKADDTSYDTNPTFNADRAQAKLGLGDSSVSSAPSSGAPTFGQPTPSNEPFDPVKARQDRLNALRQGKSQQPTPQQPSQPQQPAASTSPTPTTTNNSEGQQGNGQSNTGYSAFGRPEDYITHPTEKIPYSSGDNVTRASQLPSVQSDNEPYQQPLAINPDKAKNGQPPQERPHSSPVQSNRVRPDWRLPDYRTLLSVGSEQEFDRERLLQQARTIEETLGSFGAPGRVVEVNTGPVITQFGVEPDYLTGRNNKKQRVKVSAIAALDKDLQLALGAKSIRVEAPVPGKGYVGIEVPNEESSLVSLRDVMESGDFKKHQGKSPLAIALGQSVSGAPISADLSSMPHLLVAGTTGSGKSVCVNSIITSILAYNTPDRVKFIMVDPKRVELTGYNGIPHLVAPVVVELERIVGVLKWVTREMDDRYTRFSDIGARNIEDYNKVRDPKTSEPMPYIVVIIDELADLMMLAPEETERTITRIAALARATGIHLVIATQRPSVDVVTGLIKANFPARIAFAVAGSVDSRVILDQPGAERLLGRGDMLYLSGDSPAPLRLQGVFVSDMEIQNIVRYWKMQGIDQPKQPSINISTNVAPQEKPKAVMPRGDRVKQQAFWDSNMAASNLPADMASKESSLDAEALTGDTGGEDDLYEQAVELVRRLDRASVSLLQRRLRIGYTRAARLIDTMEARGVIGPAKEGSSKPRDVIKQ
jgi:DNA segregation ATPase FtsK/SpoIIIE-like protein